MSFEELLTLAQSGSEGALEEILARYRPLLVKEFICTVFSMRISTQELCQRQ